MRFAKYHALGNDYIVIEPAALPAGLPGDWIVRVCDRRRGVGADGILLGPVIHEDGQLAVRIFNPDGSEAGKSGNGLRIFARYLWDRGQAGSAPFTVMTAGGPVICQIHDGGQVITVTLGVASFHSRDIPVSGPPREVLDEAIVAGQRAFRMCGVSLGNPHCVLFVDAPTASLARQFGPAIEHDPRFPDRANVQFVQVTDRRSLRVEVWERGAGYTLASGSSACAAAAAAHRLGLCDAEVVVTMPGGALNVAIGRDGSVTLTGPVTAICTGDINPAALA